MSAVTVDVERHDALDGATFALVEARIDWGRGCRSSGWGRDTAFEVACAKAIGEAVERHCFLQLPPSTVRAAGAALASFIDPAELVRYRPVVDPTRRFAATPFRRHDERLWVAAKPLVSGRDTYVLADFVCHPRAFDEADRKMLVTEASTSGAAAGCNYEDAVLRAALELIERDAFMRHWFAQLPGDTVGLSSVPERVRARLARLQEQGCQCGIQCLSLGLHPVWLVWAQCARAAFTCVGTASGLHAGDALDNAMHEMETIALARLAGVPPVAMTAQEVGEPADHGALYATPGYFRRADALWYGQSRTRAYAELSSAFSCTAQALYARAAAAGHALHSIDLTAREAVGALDGRTVHTARVVGPGLIPLCFGHRHVPLGMDEWHRVGAETLHPMA